MSKKTNPLETELNKCLKFQNFLPQSTSDEGVKQRFINLYRKFVDVITYAKLMMKPTDKLTPTSIKNVVLVIATPIGEEDDEIIFRMQEAEIDEDTLKAAYDKIKKKHRSNIKSLTKKEKEALLEEYVIEEVKAMRSKIAEMKEVDSSSLLIPIGLGDVTWKIYAEQFTEKFGYKPTPFSFKDWTHYATVRVDTRELEFVISNPVVEDLELQNGIANNPQGISITELPGMDEVEEEIVPPIIQSTGAKNTYIVTGLEGPSYRDTGKPIEHFMFYENSDFILGRGERNMNLSDIPEDAMDLPDDTDEFAATQDNQLGTIPQIPSFEETLTEVMNEQAAKKAQRIELINKNVDNLLSIPKEEIDKDIALAVVAKDGTYLAFIPESVRDGEVCLKAAINNPIALMDTPKPILKEVLFNHLVEYMTNEKNTVDGWASYVRIYLGNNKLIDETIESYVEKFGVREVTPVIPEVHEIPVPQPPVFATKNGEVVDIDPEVLAAFEGKKPTEKAETTDTIDPLAALNADVLPTENEAETTDTIDPLAALNADMIPAEDEVETTDTIDPLAALNADVLPTENEAESTDTMGPLAALNADMIPAEDEAETTDTIDPLAALNADVLPTENEAETTDTIDPLAALNADMIPSEDEVEATDTIDPLAALNADVLPTENEAESTDTIDPLAALNADMIPAEDEVETTDTIDPLAALNADVLPTENEAETTDTMGPLAALNADVLPTENEAETTDTMDPLAALNADVLPTENEAESTDTIDPLAALNADMIPAEDEVETTDTIDPLAALNADVLPTENEAETTDTMDPLAALNADVLPTENEAETTDTMDPLAALNADVLPTENDAETTDTIDPLAALNADVLPTEDEAEDTAELVTPVVIPTVDLSASDPAIFDSIRDTAIDIPVEVTEDTAELTGDEPVQEDVATENSEDVTEDTAELTGGEPVQEDDATENSEDVTEDTAELTGGEPVQEDVATENSEDVTEDTAELTGGEPVQEDVATENSEDVTEDTAELTGDEPVQEDDATENSEDVTEDTADLTGGEPVQEDSADEIPEDVTEDTAELTGDEPVQEKTDISFTPITPIPRVTVDEVLKELGGVIPDVELPEDLTPVQVHDLPESDSKETEDEVTVDELLNIIEQNSDGKPSNKVEIKRSSVDGGALYDECMALIETAEQELKNNQEIMTELSDEMGLPKPDFTEYENETSKIEEPKEDKTDKPLTKDEIDALIEEIKKENELKAKDDSKPKTKYDFYTVEQLIDDIKAEKLAKQANEAHVEDQIVEEQPEKTAKKVRVYRLNPKTGEREMLTEKPKFNK